MTSQRKIGLILGVILFILLIVWLFSSDDETNGITDAQYFTSSNWDDKYDPFDKNPRGTYLFHRLIQARIGKRDIYVAETRRQLDSIIHINSKPKTYLFLGNTFGMDSRYADSIFAQVERGSDVFISFHQITNNVSRRFFKHIDFRNDYNTKAIVYTPKGKFEMLNIYEKDTLACEWLAFGEVNTRGDSRSLSSFMEMDNFIEIKIGKGRAFFHTDPQMFYNYQVKRKAGFGYTSYVLGFLSKNKDVVLLELGRVPEDNGDNDTEDDSGKDGKEDRSYLRFIFENPPLRTALLLIIAGVILYVIFRSKRKRPTVPFLEKQKDMTLAFAETITSIYFAKRNPYQLLQLQRKNFYSNINKHFFVDLNRREGDRELIILSEKSNKPLDEIKRLIHMLETKGETAVTDQLITEVGKQQRAFYKDVGIITEELTERVQKREMVFRRGLLLPSLMIIFGLFGFLVGLYLLVDAKGIGIALWPVGILLTLLGVIRLANPYLVVAENQIVYYTEFGSKKVFDRTDIISTKATKSGVMILLRNDRKLVINYWDLSSFDKKQFEHFISKVHTLEL